MIFFAKVFQKQIREKMFSLNIVYDYSSRTWENITHFSKQWVKHEKRT